MSRSVHGRCSPDQRQLKSNSERGKRATYTFMFVALYDSKGPFVLMILHHEPRDGLVIFAVYIASFDELVVQFGDGLGGVSGVQVNYDSVNHI